jgi:DNA-binding NarL/FixJ family response regulator
VQKSLTQLKSVCPAAPIIILSDVESVDYIREALEQGARGFISTSATLDVVVEATRVVWAGGTFVPASSLFVERAGAAGSHVPQLSARFTQRQLDVLELMRQGMANKSIAHKLAMSQSTVKVHVSNIMQKLKATNRTQAVFLSRDFFEIDAKD